MGDHLIYKPSQAMQSLSAMERDNINKISNYFLHVLSGDTPPICNENGVFGQALRNI